MIRICGSFVILISLSFSLYCDERFVGWDDDITINQDGTIKVEEKITIKSESIRFKRGMWRTFPTRYSGMLGLQYVVDFDVVEVKRDGQPEPYSVVERINGKQIYIGAPEVRLSPGTHTFLLSYTLNRIIGFFKTHDELYYNVIGNDVGFTVDKATARVHLPSSIPRDKITLEAYTGFFGQQGGNYTAKQLDDGSMLFETKEPLLPHQAFTIVVTWPKGYVAKPTILLTVFWLLRDNFSLILLLVGLILLLWFYLWAYRKTRIGHKEGVVIPLFYPPQDLFPGAVRYLMQKGYDALALTSDIVDMAVKGFLTIDYKAGTFLGGTYSLLPKQQPEVSKENSYYLTLYHTLSSKGGPVALTQSNNTTVQSISKTARNYYQNSMDRFIEYNRSYSGLGFFFSLIFLGVSLLGAHAYIMGTFMLWIVLYIAICVVLHIYFYIKFPLYTAAGQQLSNEIEGFKLFLATTETDRLKVIGTPPTKTPQLWEKYLPYAIALCVEQQWSAQFAPVFARLEQEGTPYTPVWYVGPGRFRTAEAATFASGLRQSFNTAITSASTSPGRSSGAGGRGSAGGGGGGGGAGGW